jgi:ABC-2 type transport system permease protein
LKKYSCALPHPEKTEGIFLRAIYKRELHGFLYTPAAYVFIAVFLTLSGVFFAVNNLGTRSGDILSFLLMMSYLWMLLSPILTMRLLAGERKQRTDQLLFTSPVSLTGIVMGKFLAACTVLLTSVLLTLSYTGIVAVFGKVYPGEVLVGYTGFFLQGCAFIALDLCVSSLAKSQATSAILAFGANLLIWLCDVLGASVHSASLSSALGFISLYVRFEPFLLGQLSFASLIYYLSFIFVMLFLTVRVMAARRWRAA